ncbi:MAG: HlyD family efflux transporter periplasmic adaptor subunit [Planctomycetales bacterium]|nr:HlyD family efflux transporter periplasmic adaptor subunit [Planctomycetales bacterium]
MNLPRQDQTNRSIGFPRASAAPAQIAKLTSEPQVTAVATTNQINSNNSATAIAPQKLPQPHKGRWFVTTVLATLLGCVALFVWQELLRYQAYGEIQGKTVRLAPIAAGTLQQLLVQEGDSVVAGQIIALVTMPEVELQYQRVSHELRLAVAAQQVRLAELEMHQQESQTSASEQRSGYFQQLGEVQRKQAKLEELSKRYLTNQQLYQRNAISDVELFASKMEFQGLRSELQELQTSLKYFEDNLQSEPRFSHDRLSKSARQLIANLQTELNELDQLRSSSQIRSPVSGIICQTHCEVGEFLANGQCIAEVLQEGSLEAVVYLPQERASKLREGQIVHLYVATIDRRLPFRIDRFSVVTSVPPAALQSRYRANRKTVPVFAKPLQATSESPNTAPWIGSEVALPRMQMSALHRRLRDRQAIATVTLTHDEASAN